MTETSAPKSALKARKSLPPPSKGSKDPLIGATLQDTYTIVRRVGEGGMSQIYEAHHARLAGRRFAIKVLRARLAKSEAIRDRFQREIKAVASISHPAVVGVFDYGVTSQGWPYMVSEFYDGLDIRACLAKYGRLSIPAVLEIGRVLSEALAATHAQGVIHRDLKPSNIFLEGDFSGKFPDNPAVKLIDFGLSRFLQQEDRSTAAGLVLGTPSYMSPEQAHGRGGDAASDIYGVGAVLYAAVTGEAPFSGKTVKETLVQVMSRRPVRPGKLRPGLPEALEVVIQRAMSREPRDRHGDMEEMVFALSNLQGLPTSVEAKARASALVTPTPRWPVRLRWMGWLVLSAGGGFALTLTSWTALRSSSMGEGVEKSALTSLLVAGGLTLVSGVTVANRRHIGMQIWSNGAQLETWIPQIRRILGAALAAYAVSGLVVGAAPVLVELSAQAGPFRVLHGPEWRGWMPLFALQSLIWMGAAALRERARGTLPTWTKVLSGVPLSCVALLGSAAVLWFGWTWPVP